MFCLMFLTLLLHSVYNSVAQKELIKLQESDAIHYHSKKSYFIQKMV